jgi:hypothetical protein
MPVRQYDHYRSELQQDHPTERSLEGSQSGIQSDRVLDHIRQVLLSDDATGVTLPSSIELFSFFTDEEENPLKSLSQALFSALQIFANKARSRLVG